MFIFDSVAIGKSMLMATCDIIENVQIISWKFQNRGKFPNNAENDVKQISSNGIFKHYMF